MSSENLTPMAHAAQNSCFGCGPANPVGLHLEFAQADDGLIVCQTTVAIEFEGPTGYLHGGMIATMLDETMSKAVRAGGHIAMTRHMEVDYLKPVPSGQPIRLEARLTREEGRKSFAEGRILNAHGTMLAQSKGLFIDVRDRA